MRYIVRIVLVGLLVAAGGAATAQDGLYAPVRPDETALVRVIHANPEDPTARVTIDIGTTRFDEVAAQTGTAYRPVRPGVYVVMAYGRREALTATTGSFYTVTVRPDGITILSDTYHDDPLRAQIVLYNLTGSPVSLDAVVPEAPLLDGVAPFQAGTRVINAIPVTLAVSRTDGLSNGEADAASAGSAAGSRGAFEVSLELERGSSYGIMVQEGPGGLSGFVVEAAVHGGAAE